MAGKQFRKIFPVLITIAFMLVALASGQSFRGSIRGKVTDPNGNALPNATVSAKSNETGLTRSAMTGDDGGYVLAELPAGVYTVTASLTNLSPAAMNVRVNVGVDTTADFDLTQVEKRQEQLTVTADAPLVEATRDVLGAVVERTLVNELPLNGRDFGKLVALVPGATVEPSGVAGTQFGFGQFNINGNRDRSNNYSLDGTDNNDPYLNNSALNQVGITGAPASLLPIDAIQEFNLQSHFGAEYGRNSGSVVNILTRSGTNQLHGTAFGFFRNSALDARNFFNTEDRKTSFQNSQFGASIGGPIIKDRTFFFGAYEGQRERVGSDFVLQVPTVDQRNRARQIALDSGLLVNGINPGLEKVLDFFPVSDTPTIPGVVRDKNDMDSLLVKLDHNFTGTEQLTARYAFARSEQVFPLGSADSGGKGSRLPEFAQTSPTRVQVLSASFLSTLDSSRINEIRFGYSRYRTSFSSVDINQGFDPAAIGLDFGFGKLGLPEIDFFAGIENLGAQGFSVPRGRTSQTFQILDNFTWVRGRHTIKFGGEYRRSAVENFNDNLERGIIQFFPDGLDPEGDPVVDSLANFYLGGPDFDSFVLALTGDTHRTNYNNGLSFFAEDDIRVRPNFTLNLGMRWEYFGPISEKDNLLSNLGRDGQLAMVGTDGLSGAYERDLNNFGPRIGFSWNVQPRTVVRGGYGFFYDYVPQHLFLASFEPSAGIATNPIGPKPVSALSFNGDAFAGNVPGPIYSLRDAPPDIFITPRKFATPYIQNWNFNLQREITSNLAAEVGYVGSKGTRLVRLIDANQPDVNGNRVTFPQYGFVHELTPIANSTYHALQSTVRVQGWAGVSGFATYTWSKSLDDASDGIDFIASAALPQDSTNLKAEHGPSTFDTKHRFTAAVNYRIPEWSALPKRLASGWQLNWIWTAQSGRPLPIVTNNDTSALPNDNFNTRSFFHQRPNILPGVNPIRANWSPISGYLNPDAFAQPDDGTFGNLGRGAVYGPKYWNADFSISKNTMITDQIGLQLRAEFFNIFNHPNFALPNSTFGTDSFGLITQTPDVAQGNPGLGGGGPRVMQVGLKLAF